MNRIRPRLATPDISLTEFDHPPGEEHHDPEFERSERHAIAFVEQGSFDIASEGKRWRFGEGTLFVTRPGMTFTCSHGDACPSDVCLSVGFGEGATEALLLAGVPEPVSPLARATPRQRYLRHRIATCAAGDEVRLDILAGALFASLAEHSNDEPRFANWRVSDAMRRIGRAAEKIESEYGSSLALRELADAAGMSMYHFARTFGALTGVPPHRYLAAVRLRHAARRLAEGASVSSTALDVGFGSLSHFINAFRRHYGMSPSEARRASRPVVPRVPVADAVWR